MPVLKQWGKVAASLLMALGLCVLSAQAVDEPPFTYYYQLEKVVADAGGKNGDAKFNTYFKLYVARQGDNAPPLHAGSIALATSKKEYELQFEPAEHWTKLPQEAGTATVEHEGYLSFHWGVKAPQPGEDGYEIPEEADGRQFIGTLAVLQNSGASVDDIVLLPWPETETGAARVKAWQDETDPARKQAYLMTLETIWRMDDDSRPADGYYQGYYQWSEPAGTEGGTAADTQRAVDIQNGWQAFRVQSYNPFKDVTLTATSADGVSYTYTAVYDAAAQGSTAPGRVTFAPDLTLLKRSDAPETVKATEPGGEESLSLPDGTYTLKVQKPSHASVTYTGLEVKDGKLFPALTGKVCYLPCGDVTGGANGEPDERIKQADRAYLTRPGIYGKSADKTNLLDLDGDGHVGQRDLAIVTAPENYGKSAKTIPMKSGTEGGTT